MVLTRRTLLRSFAGLAALSLAACRMPATAFRPPVAMTVRTPDPQHAIGVQTALVNALAYARASQLWDPAISAPFYTKRWNPLSAGTAKPDEACKAAADAINAVLQGKAGTPAAETNQMR